MRRGGIAIYTPGPVEMLARLSLQSQRYVNDPEYRDAVDAVLGCPQYDAAPALVAALEWIADHGDTGGGGRPAYHDMRAKARAALALARGNR